MSKKTDLYIQMRLHPNEALKTIVDMDLLATKISGFSSVWGLFVWAVDEAFIRHVDDELEERLVDAINLSKTQESSV